MKILLPIILALVLVGGYFALKQNSNQLYKPPSLQISSPSPTPQLKTFKSSSTMKLTINVPIDSLVEEKFGSVTIAIKDEKIYVDQNGTNFDNLKGYLEDLKIKNRFTLLDEKEVEINGQKALMGFINDEKIYFIYNKYHINTISTKSKSLYSALDQIAQSFRYTP